MLRCAAKRGTARPIIFEVLRLLMWNRLLPEEPERKWSLWGWISTVSSPSPPRVCVCFTSYHMTFSPQRPYPWTLAAGWFWTRERVENITSAGTTTSRPTLAPSSGTEAAAATGTASTPRRSVREHVWSPESQVLLLLYFHFVKMLPQISCFELLTIRHVVFSSGG